MALLLLTVPRRYLLVPLEYLFVIMLSVSCRLSRFGGVGVLLSFFAWLSVYCWSRFVCESVLVACGFLGRGNVWCAGGVELLLLSFSA